MSKRLRNESGMTLVELLVAMTTGMFVLLGGYIVLDVAIKTQKGAEDRVATISQGRRAMEDMTRQLRSQMCLGRDTVPIIDARPNRIEFYGSLAPASTTTTYQKRTLQYEPDADGTRGSIKESVVTGTGAPPAVQFTAAPVERILVRDVKPSAAGLFRYFAFESETAPAVREVTANPVTPVDRQLTVEVRVAFEVLPQRGRPQKSASLFNNKIYVRTADPTDPTRSPKCS